MTLIAFEKYQMPLVVVTRPFPDCTRTAQQAEYVGFETFEEPLGVVHYKSMNRLKLPKDVGLILTSHRAVSCLKTISFSSYPIFYVVGERTAQCLRQNGFDNIEIVQANVENLIEWMNKRSGQIKHPVLYVRGRDITAPLKSKLKSSGFDITEKIVYSVDEVESFSDEFQTLLQSQREIVVLLTSTRTAKCFQRLLKEYKGRLHAPLRYLCFSPKIAKTFKNTTKSKVEYCDDPTEDALIQKLMLMYDEKI